MTGSRIYIILMCTLMFISCKHKVAPQPADANTVEDNFPGDIRKIVVDKCATAGCHNANSYKGAGGLLLDSWEHLFEGGSNGAVVIPYSPGHSSLLYFVNAYPEYGTTAEPRMPYNAPLLSREEYLTLRDWIERGAPDKNGKIPFAENAATRQKIYMVQQGCDLVAVIDAEKQVVMRYIPVGKSYDTENPNNIVISPDGRFAYISFWNLDLVQKIDTRTDSVVAEFNTPRSFQQAIALSRDGSKLISCNWYSQEVLIADANQMQLLHNLGNQMQFIGGFAGNAGSTAFYATSRFGNTLYKISVAGGYKTLSIDGNPAIQESKDNTPDPYRVALSPDDNRYFITCTNTNEVRVMDAANEQIIKAIPVGNNPQEMAFSRSLPYLFVSCMNDTVSRLDVGSVYVINYKTLEVVKKITGKFFQPHGLAADDRNGLFYIFSRNEDKNGPPPHHSSPCNGRNGFYQVYDINTLEPHTGKRFEVTVDPYGAATRFSN